MMRALHPRAVILIVIACAALASCGGNAPTGDSAGDAPTKTIVRTAPHTAAPARDGDQEALLESLAGEILLDSGEAIGTIELSAGRGEVRVAPPGTGNSDVLLSARTTDAHDASIMLELREPNDGSPIGTLSLTETERGRPRGKLTINGESWDVEVPVIAELEGPIDYGPFEDENPTQAN